MTVLLDSRSRKALEIAAGASRWTRLVGRAFAVPSQSDPRQIYVTSADTCTCPDSERHPDQRCKHSTACALVLALIDSQPEPRPSKLVPTREDADTIGWDRPVYAPISDTDASRLMGRL